MKLPQQVQLASLLSWHGQAIAECVDALPTDALAQYWANSHARLERWRWELKALTQESGACWISSRHIVSEMLVSGTVTDVVMALAAACDRKRGTSEAAPIAGSVLAAHGEVRSRALDLLARAHGLNDDLKRWLWALVDRTRLATESLVSHMNTICAAEAEHRQAAFGGSKGNAQRRIELTLLCLDFAGLDVGQTRNTDLNRAIASSLLQCLPQRIFDGAGVDLGGRSFAISAASSDRQMVANSEPLCGSQRTRRVIRDR